MDERRAGDERLPWLETVPARATALPAAARRSRTPLLVLLALFVAGGIAVMAFLAGRTTAPAERRQAAAQPTVPVPATAPVAIAPVAAPPEAAVAAPAQPRASTNRRASASRVRHFRRHVAHRRARPDRRGMVPQIERAFPLAPMVYATPAPAAPPAAKAPAPPSPRASPPPIARMPAAFSRGGVVQLGAYVSTPLLASSWARLVGAYPYLGTLPRMVTGTAVAGRPYYYRLRVAAGSRRQALALCDHLHRIGRGCMVIRTQG